MLTWSAGELRSQEVYEQLVYLERSSAALYTCGVFVQLYSIETKNNKSPEYKQSPYPENNRFVYK